jgi:hypothetical protein
MRRALSSLGLWTLAAAAVAVTSPTGNAADEPAAPPAPRAGCTTFTDAKGDAELGGELPNDPDLDIVSVVLATPPGLLRAYVTVDKLDAPDVAPGHQFTVTMLLDGKPVVFYAGANSSAQVAGVRGAAEGADAINTLSGVRYDGLDVPGATTDAVFDTKTSTVVLTTSRAPIEAASKKSLADGVVVTGVTAKSLGDFLYTVVAADTITGADADASKYTLGHNPCFAPPEGRLSLQVPVSVVSGHSALVSGVLTNEAGAAVGGKTVKLTVAGKSATVTSGADGKFSASFAITSNAGPQPVTATWAGDDTLQAVTATAPLLVTIQPTSTGLTSAVSGTGVVAQATLLNDLRKPVAGQTITWYVDGKAAGTSRTDAAGRASLRTVKGKLVKAAFAGVRNHYAASSASRRT